MKRVHVIAISVLIGFISGVAVAPAKASPALALYSAGNHQELTLICKTTDPYSGREFAVIVGEDLKVDETAFEIDANDSNYHADNPMSTATLSRTIGGGWHLSIISKLSPRTISAVCFGG